MLYDCITNEMLPEKIKIFEVLEIKRYKQLKCR